MKSLDELKAQQAKELAELEKAHAIAACLPVEGARVMPFAATGTPWVNYKVKGIAGALDLIRAFVVVPFGEYRNGCLKLAPAEQLSEAWREDNAACWAASLHVNQSVGERHSYGPSARVTFFARVPGVGLVRVNADIAGQGYIDSCPRFSASYQIKAGRLIRDSVRANAKLNGYADKYIKWAGGDAENLVYEYLFSADVADDDMPGADCSHLCGQFEAMADELDVKEA